MALFPSGRSGAPPAAGNVVVVGLIVVAGAFALSRGLTSVSFGFAAGALVAVALFVAVFVRTDFGLYLVIFSMLLSPEFATGGGTLAERRQVVVRSEDLILIVIGLSWFAKTAVNKELGLVAKTPLNRPILVYVVATAGATLAGYLFGTVGTAAGFLYVLKYVEYFVVYYMIVNNLRDRQQAWRLVTAAFLTAAIVSVVGLTQIPSGERVSAPFEGEVGEPNTFGGYLLFMMALAAGLALETARPRVRGLALGLLALMAPPFVFTLSRASYLGAVPAFLVLTALGTRRRVMVALLLVLAVGSPLVTVAVPRAVVDRVLYTFQPEAGQPTIKVGRVAFDPSTSARFISFQQALEGWWKRPVLGHGVTGFGFLDAQYFRTLVETGVVGMAAFLWLMWSVLRSGLAAFRDQRDREGCGLALGFLAGTVGLLFHAIGSNTFIIVRIMEPFWFMAGVVVMLPVLEREERAATPAPGAPAQRAAAS